MTVQFNDPQVYGGCMATIIAVEGPDRVGKATQVKLLRNHLLTCGHTVATVEVPVKDGHTHKIIYWMLRNGLAKKFPKLFQWLQVLNRKIFQGWFLKTLASEVDYVIFDRWNLSTYVYGTAMGLSINAERLFSSLIRPDATVVIVGHIPSLTARDSYESDSGLQDRVNLLYRDWAMSNDDAILVDAVGPREEVHNNILSQLVNRNIIKQENT